jgi:hypothetical protein
VSSDDPTRNWPPDRGLRGCGAGVTFFAGVALNLPLAVLAVTQAESGAPWPGVVLSLVLIGLAVGAFRRRSWLVRSGSLGLLAGWALLTIVTAGSCTGFQRFELYG